MIRFNVEELLEKKNKTKYWLCQQMDVTYTNLSKVIKGKTKSISFKYLERLCKYLECTLDELITIEFDEEDDL